MRYIKTFESFSEGVGTDNPEEILLSPEMQSALANVAEEEGLNPAEIAKSAEEIVTTTEAPKGVLDMEEVHNEEEEPITIGLILGAAAGLAALWGGAFGLAAWSQNTDFKNLVHRKAVEEVNNLVKENPSIINQGYENLIKKAYDRMMADKQFVEETKKRIAGYGGRYKVGGGAPL